MSFIFYMYTHRLSPTGYAICLTCSYKPVQTTKKKTSRRSLSVSVYIMCVCAVDTYNKMKRSARCLKHSKTHARTYTHKHVCAERERARERESEREREGREGWERGREKDKR